jgi:hypothetical protein
MAASMVSNSPPTVGPGEPGDDADQVLVLDLAVAILRHAEVIREVIG